VSDPHGPATKTVAQQLLDKTRAEQELSEARIKAEKLRIQIRNTETTIFSAEKNAEIAKRQPDVAALQARLAEYRTELRVLEEKYGLKPESVTGRSFFQRLGHWLRGRGSPSD
jgi:predicted  nucleic acid-binding Zn-ribbon protein